MANDKQVDVDEADYLGELITRLGKLLVEDEEAVRVTHQRVEGVTVFQLVVSANDLCTMRETGFWHITDLENLLLAMGRKDRLKCRLTFAKAANMALTTSPSPRSDAELSGS